MAGARVVLDAPEHLKQAEGRRGRKKRRMSNRSYPVLPGPAPANPLNP